MAPSAAPHMVVSETNFLIGEFGMGILSVKPMCIEENTWVNLPGWPYCMWATCR